MDVSLVDRDRELDHLQAALDGAAAGQGSLTVLSGEAGIGKSALANAFAAGAGAAGFTVAWGRAWEAGGAPPLWPWTEVVRELVPMAAGIDLRDVGELLPEIGAPRVAPTDVDQARFRLYDATARLLRRLATSPLAIVLEDLHAADQGTLELLHFLAPALARSSIAIVGTWRDPESQLAPSAELFARIGADAHTIPLARLSDAAVLALVARAGHGPDVAQRLIANTEGNPLVVVESLRLLRATGTTAALPARVQNVMQQRLALLPAETRTLLELASADGRTTDVGTVCIASGRARSDVLRALRSAVEAQVIDMSNPERLSFTHVLLRDVLYADLGEAQRLAAHAALVKALEERVSLDPRTRTVGLARHAVEAAPLVGIAKAVDYTRAAAERALELQAHEEAVALLEKALAILDLLGDDGSHRFALLLALGRAHMRAEDSTRGRLVCRDAAAIARRRGRAADLAQVALAYGEYLSFAMLDRELQALLEEALAAVGDSDESLRARLLARLAASLQPAPDPAQPISMAREAIALARKSSDARIRLEVLDAAGAAIAYFGHPDERLVLDNELSEIASVLGDHVRLARSLVRIAFDCWEQGDRAGAERATESHARTARALGQPSHRRRMLLLGNIANVLDGRLDEARDTMARASAIDPERRATRIATVSQRAAIAFATEDALELGAVEPELTAVLHGLDAAYLLPLVSRIDAALGRDEALAAKLDEARRTPELWRGRPMVTGLAVGCARLGDAKTAAALYETALPFARRNYTWGIGSMVVEGPMGEAVGLFARAMGREEEAVAHLEQALADAVRLGAVLHAARIRRHLGAERATPLLERTGDIWRLRFAGADAHVKDSRGLQILAHLVSHPGQEVHVFDLLGVEGDTGDAGPALDREAIEAYRARVTDLQSEIDQAEQWGETDKATRLQEELDAIARELGRGVGLGGRPRQEKAAVERARVNVRRRVVLALQQIEAVAPALAAHLSAAVRTGVTCVYDVRVAPPARG